MNRLKMLPVVVLAIAAVAVGCGGDDESGSAGGAGGSSEAAAGKNSESGGSAPEVTTSSLTKAQFVKRANAACREERSGMLGRLAAYQRENPAASDSQTERFDGAMRAVLLPTIEAETVKVAELGAPEGEEARVDAFLVAQQDALEEVEAQENLESLEQVESYFAEAGKLARQYGLDECSNGPAPANG